MEKGERKHLRGRKGKGRHIKKDIKMGRRWKRELEDIKGEENEKGERRHIKGEENGKGRKMT